MNTDTTTNLAILLLIGVSVGFAFSLIVTVMAFKKADQKIKENERTES